MKKLNILLKAAGVLTGVLVLGTAAHAAYVVRIPLAGNTVAVGTVGGTETGWTSTDNGPQQFGNFLINPTQWTLSGLTLGQLAEKTVTFGFQNNGSNYRVAVTLLDKNAGYALSAGNCALYNNAPEMGDFGTNDYVVHTGYGDCPLSLSYSQDADGSPGTSVVLTPHTWDGTHWIPGDSYTVTLGAVAPSNTANPGITVRPLITYDWNPGDQPGAIDADNPTRQIAGVNPLNYMTECGATHLGDWWGYGYDPAYGQSSCGGIEIKNTSETTISGITVSYTQQTSTEAGVRELEASELFMTYEGNSEGFKPGVNPIPGYKCPSGTFSLAPGQSCYLGFVVEDEYAAYSVNSRTQVFINGTEVVNAHWRALEHGER